MFRKASAALLALAASTLAAQAPPDAEPAPRSEVALPRGPIKITAERAELERRETALYRGNVKLVSEDLVMTGDRLELRQPVKGQFEARLTGTPARLTHTGESETPPVSASAETLRYDTQSGIVDLSGAAALERGGDAVSGHSIRYYVADRRISATGVDGGQVQIVIQPPEQSPPQEKNPPVPQNTGPSSR
jgi:lipopolysaccharide export system protein LptA